MTPIRVLLVDDHTLFRSGIKALLTRDPAFEVVGEAADGLEGAKRAKSSQPDIVLLDLHMPGVGGRDALALIHEEAPSARVLMLTVSEDGDDLLDTLRAGATGYLLKNIDAQMLIDGIKRAAEGDSVIAPRMTSKLVDGVKRSSAAAAETEKLSARELEILAALARGASNKHIARELSLAESTVKIHVQHILRKLNLTSRVQAAVYAVEQGLAAKT